MTSGKVYKDPSGGIGLVGGAITLALPKGWVRVQHSGCSGGTIDSTVVCQDITTIASSNLVKDDGTVSWGATVGAYSYGSSDGTAKNWYVTKYDGNPLSAYGSPEAVNISTNAINGYSALSFQSVSPPLDNPGYTNAHFAVVHGKYAAEVDAQMQSSTAYGSSAFDYRSMYLNDLTQMMQSIKFQDWHAKNNHYFYCFGSHYRRAAIGMYIWQNQSVTSLKKTARLTQVEPPDFAESVRHGTDCLHHVLEAVL